MIPLNPLEIGFKIPNFDQNVDGNDDGRAGESKLFYS